MPDVKHQAKLPAQSPSGWGWGMVRHITYVVPLFFIMSSAAAHGPGERVITDETSRSCTEAMYTTSPKPGTMQDVKIGNGRYACSLALTGWQHVHAHQYTLLGPEQLGCSAAECWCLRAVFCALLQLLEYSNSVHLSSAGMSSMGSMLPQNKLDVSLSPHSDGCVACRLKPAIEMLLKRMNCCCSRSARRHTAAKAPAAGACSAHMRPPLVTSSKPERGTHWGGGGGGRLHMSFRVGIFVSKDGS